MWPVRSLFPLFRQLSSCSLSRIATIGLCAFHCFQSNAFAIVSMIPRMALYLPVAGLFLWPMLELALFVLWVVLLVKAFQGQKFKLPLVGEWAEDQAVKAA